MRNGGLAVHGGLILCFIVGYSYADIIKSP
ncbi:MAG: hypothetical protein ACLTK0_04065 [Anaerovoracaceae bacterium]